MFRPMSNRQSAATAYRSMVGRHSADRSPTYHRGITDRSSTVGRRRILFVDRRSGRHLEVDRRVATDSRLTVGRHIGRFKSAISAATRPISIDSFHRVSAEYARSQSSTSSLAVWQSAWSCDSTVPCKTVVYTD